MAGMSMGLFEIDTRLSPAVIWSSLVVTRFGCDKD